MNGKNGEWLTISELRAKLKLSRSHFYRVTKRPGFPRASTALGPPRYFEPEVDKYMLEHRDCLLGDEGEPVNPPIRLLGSPDLQIC